MLETESFFFFFPIQGLGSFPSWLHGNTPF